MSKTAKKIEKRDDVNPERGEKKIRRCGVCRSDE